MTAVIRRPNLVLRPVPGDAAARLSRDGAHPVLARLLAARGVSGPEDLDTSLDGLLPWQSLLRADEMATVLADTIEAGRRILIVGDYDADGATAAAVGYLALAQFGATVETLVPNRFEFGYGLTPEIVGLAAGRHPDVIVTVDNGIASHAGVAAARSLGIEVLVTDHHLPGATLPDASVIVNPNQPGCPFASKHLAGVGVMFYVMVALRSELRRRGAFAAGREPNLGELLDLVALGTVADVVRLDRNNRTLVAQGLKRICAGRTRHGLAAIARAAGRDLRRMTCHDLGFVLGPRLNAAGRLEDMSLGIECLVTADEGRADELARTLDRLNRERREIESEMQQRALAGLDEHDCGGRAALVMHDPGWHPGVIGLLAARLRERYHRPALCFAAGPGGELKGSGRSIPALHLRDALDLVDRRHPGLMLRFGGHAAAAGVSLRPEAFGDFQAAFEETVRQLLSPADLEEFLETDGPLGAEDLTLPVAELLRNQVWGHGFPPPLFEDRFDVRAQRIVGARHLRLTLRRTADAGGRDVSAMLFRHAEALPGQIHATYRLDVNEWNGAREVQLIVDHWEPAA